MTSLKNKFVYQLLLSSTQVLLPLVTYPYITRVLGPDNLGKVNYVDFLSQLFMIAAAFGTPFYAVREIAMTRDNNITRAVLIKELAILQAIFAVIATAFFVLFTFRNWEISPALYAMGAANILVSSFSFDWYIQGMEQFRFAAVRTIAVRLAMLVSLFILVKNQQDYSTYFAIFSAGMFMIALFNSAKLLKENHFTRQPVNLRRHLVPLWHFFLTSSAISIYIYFDTIILKHITNDNSIVGYYTTVLKMVKIFLVVIMALGTVLMPRISYLVSTGNTIEMKRHLNNLLQFIIVAGVPVCCGLFILAPEIVRTIAGDQFLPAVPLMRILAFLPLIIGLSNLFCFQTLIPFKQEKKFLFAVIIGCVTSVSLNFLLIPHFAAAGAAYACVTTELIITIITGMLANRLIRFNAVSVTILQTIFTSLLFVPVVLVCRSQFAAPLLILLSSIPVCVIIYFLIQYLVFNNNIIVKMKDYALNQVKF